MENLLHRHQPLRLFKRHRRRHLWPHEWLRHRRRLHRRHHCRRCQWRRRCSVNSAALLSRRPFKPINITPERITRRKWPGINIIKRFCSISQCLGKWQLDCWTYDLGHQFPRGVYGISVHSTLCYFQFGQTVYLSHYSPSSGADVINKV